MSYKIAIAGGKGGTGKTTVSVTLYHFLNRNKEKKVQLVDCDVEEPNDKPGNGTRKGKGFHSLPK